MIDINRYIAEAMKKRETGRLGALKLIKTELVKAEKNGITLDEAVESKILLKMIEQRKDSIAQYLKGGRQDLAEAEQNEIKVIEEFIPEQPTEEEIANYTEGAIDAYVEQNGADYVISMKDMKPILSIVQERYPTANGKIVSKILKDKINN